MSAEILISLEALATMIKYDLSVQGKETAGLLIGHEKDNILYVDEVRIGGQDANAVHVEITTEELVMAAIEISERSDGKSIVGWIHTHPGLSAFLSPTDVNTQLIYQAQMPNAIAVVIDAVKYSHTQKLDDLDLKVFRVENKRAVQQKYKIVNSIEFGMNAFVLLDKNTPISTRVVTKEIITEAYAPVMDERQLIIMKANITKLYPQMRSEDAAAVKAWIELAESMQSGDIKEVPVDVVNLEENLLDSIDRIDNNLVELEFDMEDKAAQKSMIAILIAMIIEFFVFYFFLV